jgi:hypothetical protein
MLNLLIIFAIEPILTMCAAMLLIDQIRSQNGQSIVAIMTIGILTLLSIVIGCYAEMATYIVPNDTSSRCARDRKV